MVTDQLLGGTCLMTMTKVLMLNLLSPGIVAESKKGFSMHLTSSFVIK